MSNQQTPLKRWGYKGIETALNGLINWLEEHETKMQGSSAMRREKYCNLIIEYAKKNIPGFVKRGHLENCADFVAKKIQKNNKFIDFINWIKQNS